METYGIVSVLGMALAVLLWFLKRANDRKKLQDEIDKQIEAADSMEQFVRLSDRLRNK